MITFRDFSYRFAGSTYQALLDVNLDIAPGEFVVIAGPSGCGKSTLALAIGGYLFSQYEGNVSGSVHVAGMDVQQTPIYDVAEVVGLVQQNPEAQFCTLTVQDEIAFGLENRCLPREEIRQRIEWALNVMGGRHLLDRELATLSGGEQQKVAIAAMMAARPQVLIFDEPTSNLDPSATVDIFDVIADIRASSALTVIVIEHKVSYLAPFTPRLVEMEGGAIIREGCAGEARSFWTASKPSKAGADDNQGPPLVQTENLYAVYGDRDVLRGISVTIGPGEFVAVMGDNGSGKSTFLQCLMGLVKPSQGHVNVLGRDMRQAHISEMARQVGLVFQNPEHQLFAPTVWDEAVFAPHNFGMLDEAVQGRTKMLLQRCGLERREGDSPYRLSHGQKRRLNLISILTYRPAVILLDEILIGQDAANADFLLNLLCEHTTNGGAVIMVNHNPEATYRYASRLLFFSEGRIIVDGPVAEGFHRLEQLGKSAYLPWGWPNMEEAA